MIHSDLTILYYTANNVGGSFMANTQEYLLKAVGDTPIVSVSFKPTVIGKNCKNLCIGEYPRSVYMIYLQVMMAAREAQTKYVATAEDDMLYSPEHFAYRPTDDDTLSYNVNKWSIFSWVKPPIFSYRERKSMTSLVTTKKTLLNTLEERYAKYPVLENIPEKIYKLYWGEPGRFELHLGITPRKTEEFKTKVPNIVFSTSEALGFTDLGSRKAHSKIQADRVEPWGTAEEVLRLYN